jgi:FkbM family methyltransferase
MEAVLNTVRRLRHGAIGKRLPLVWSAVRPFWRLAARIGTGGQGFPHLINGVDKFRLTLDQMPNNEPLEWEPEQYLDVMSAIEPGAHVLDVGAFWGLFSLGAAKRIGPSGRVVAVEPGPRQFSMLQTNIRINQFNSTINCTEEICADKANSFIDFYADPDGSMVDSAVPDPNRAATAIRRRTTTVDELVSRFELHPDVMKIDVEGFEDLVLVGASETLARFRPILFVEFHPEELASRGSSCDAVLKMLGDYGYQSAELSSSANVKRGCLIKFVRADEPIA